MRLGLHELLTESKKEKGYLISSKPAPNLSQAATSPILLIVPSLKTVDIILQ